MLKRPRGVLQLEVCRNKKLTLSLLGGLGAHLGKPHLLRRGPTERLSTRFSLASVFLHPTKHFCRLIDQIKSTGGPLRHQRRTWQPENVFVVKTLFS